MRRIGDLLWQRDMANSSDCVTVVHVAGRCTFTLGVDTTTHHLRHDVISLLILRCAAEFCSPTMTCLASHSHAEWTDACCCQAIFPTRKKHARGYGWGKVSSLKLISECVFFLDSLNIFSFPIFGFVVWKTLNQSWHQQRCYAAFMRLFTQQDCAHFKPCRNTGLCLQNKSFCLACEEKSYFWNHQDIKTIISIVFYWKNTPDANHISLTLCVNSCDTHMWGMCQGLFQVSTKQQYNQRGCGPLLYGRHQIISSNKIKVNLLLYLLWLSITST